jgi:hypothetical protein
MARRVDQALFEKLLEAYRADPGNISTAARYAGVTRRTARQAWETGWPDKPWGVKSIKDLLADDKDIARARLELEDERDGIQADHEALEAERDREAARQHAIRSKQEEGQLVQATRALTMNALGAAAKAAAGMQAGMTRLSKELVDLADSGKALSQKEIGQLSSIMRRYSSSLRDLASAGQLAMEMERLYLGEPSQIIGVMSEYDTMPMEELIKAAGYQDQILRRAADRGLIVLDGGLGKTAEPGKP